jgi:hypothetical protein
MIRRFPKPAPFCSFVLRGSSYPGSFGFTTRVMIALGLIGYCLAASSAAQDPTADYDTKGDVADRISQRLRTTWQEFEVIPSKRATEGEWCRRLFLDVLGRIPTREEVISFVADRDRSKREKLVDALLYDERYADEYVDRWATIWTNVLIGRTGGQENNSLTNREGLRLYLETAFSENRAYDQFAKELITATGSNRLGEAGYNGAVNFLTGKLEDRATQATARTAQVFLGVQMQCTQCHNHPFNDWKQDRYWQLNAFFRQAVALRRYDQNSRNVRIRAVELADQDFGGEGSTPEEAEVYYELRNGRLAAAYPVFFDGTPLDDRSGHIEDVNRRQELARFIVESPAFAQSLVNRYWSYFFGYGLTTPIDDMGPHNPTPHQALLEELASALAQHDFDLKQLIRWIALSQPYALSSRIGSRHEIDEPSRGSRPLFSRSYLRQLRPEELYRSLLVVSYAKLTSELAAKHRPTRDAWLRQFTQSLGNDEGDEITSFGGTIPQTLVMFNGKLMQSAMAVTKKSFLGELTGELSLDFNQKIDRLFWAAVARKPTAQERRAAAQLTVARAEAVARPDGRDNSQPRADPHRDALQDIWWALLNSNEFILNH